MLNKILAINLFIFAAYALLITYNSSITTQGFNIAIGMGACIFFQVILNVILGIASFIMSKQEPGRSFLISAAILVPVGFVAWLILLSIYG